MFKSKSVKTLVLAAAIGIPLGTLASAGSSWAQSSPETVQLAEKAQPRGAFVRKQKSISGDWSVVTVDGQTVIRFYDNFRARSGPDLKVFLSPQSVDQVSGKTATNGAVLLGKLKSTKGTQDYVVPEGVTITNFGSVLVHCEAYSVLWGGGALS